jgi:predicted HAD superfamily Cof-like phosphohydrolase
MALGMGIDLPEVVREIHRSNMTKLDRDGKPIYREDGKVLKGEDYEPPNLEGVLYPE